MYKLCVLEKEREKFHNSGICTISTLHPRISFVHVNLGQPSHRRIVTHVADTISVLHNARLVSKKKKKRREGKREKEKKIVENRKRKQTGFFSFCKR